MVGIIRPVVYRDHQLLNWAIALLLHLLGNILGAIVIGVLFGMLGQLLVPRIGGRTLWIPAVLGPLSVLYSLAEIDLVRLPNPQWDQQVPEIWRRKFHPQIASLLYGLALGMGVTTRIITGMVYIVLLGILAWGNLGYAILTFSLCGVGRVLPVVLIGGHLRSFYTGERIQSVLTLVMEQRQRVLLLNSLILAFAGGYWLAGMFSFIR